MGITDLVVTKCVNDFLSLGCSFRTFEFLGPTQRWEGRPRRTLRELLEVRSKAAEDRNTDWKVVIQQNPHFPSVGPDKKRLTMASIWCKVLLYFQMHSSSGEFRCSDRCSNQAYPTKHYLLLVTSIDSSAELKSGLQDSTVTGYLLPNLFTVQWFIEANCA